jgi:xylulokinase
MYLGIDLGTSSIKLILTGDGQDILAQACSELVVQRPQALWSEQAPESWWQGLLHCLRQLQDSAGDLLPQVRAIGLSGQQHGAVLLNANGEVLRPAILWNDGRSMQQCQQLMQAVPRYAQITGNLVMPGFTAPKLLWVAEHEPEIFVQIDKVLLPKDYLRYRMSNVFATDMSDAAGTSWLDVGQRDWSTEMLAATGLSLSQMPSLFEGSAVTANLSADFAAQWGFDPDVALAAGAGDNAAAAMSLGVVSAGTAFLSLGTSGTYFVAEDNFSPNASLGVHTFCHCLPNMWHQMNCHLSAASCLSWWAQACGHADVEALLLEAEQLADFTTEVIFLPYLSGERSPHSNPYAQGVFFGITHDTSRAQLTQAVLEGVAFNFAQGQNAMLASGTHINEVAVVGGGARSTYWGSVLATALQQPLTYYKDREVGAALGAARLAYLAVNTVDASHAFAKPEIEFIIEPEANFVEAFAAKQVRFEELYQRLQTFFHEEK